MATVLVVEDEGLVARDLARTLVGMGHRVPATAKSGPEALARAEEHAPDLVLMDVMLQGDMDGVQTARALRARRDVPVVYLTANADALTVDRARDTAPYGYLLKPFNERELGTTLEMALHKHALERALREREAWLGTTLRSIGDAVVAVDPHARVVLLNAAAEALCGWGEREASGRPVDEVLRCEREDGSPSPAGCALGRALHERRRVQSHEGLVLLTRAGERVPVEETAAPILEEGGRLLGAVLVLRDVRAQRRLQERLALGDRLASLGALAAGVAHEMNNPLAFTLGNVNFALTELDELCAPGGPLAHLAPLRARLAEVREALGEAAEGGRRMRTIVQDLRDFARGDEGGPSGATDVRAVLERALRLARKTLEVQAGGAPVLALEPLPTVFTREGRLHQLLLDLLLHAARAGAGHPVRVACAPTGEGGVRVSVEHAGRAVPPEVLRRLFEPFFTSHLLGQGSGVGLSVAHGLARGLGGDLTAEPRTGGGLCFTLWLPPQAPPEPQGPARRVLWVGPGEPDALYAACPGLEVVAVPRGREALGRLAQGERYALVVVEPRGLELGARELMELMARLEPTLPARVAFTDPVALPGGGARCLAWPPTAEAVQALLPPQG